MKNSTDLRGCYPPRLSASVDNTLLDLQKPSYPTKAEFNNCFILNSKYFPFPILFWGYMETPTIFSALRFQQGYESKFY